MTIVVTGGSGFIGTALTKALLAKGYTVIVIDTRAPRLTHQQLFYIPCDLETSMLPFNVLDRTDAVIHLAGKTIFRKWTTERKNEIKESRINTTRNLVESMRATKSKPSIFIAASTVGYYGEGMERDLDERSGNGETFLAKLAEEWERESIKAEELGCRTVVVRAAPVVGRGGFLGLMFKWARFHLAFRLSKKDYWMPWIHLNDLVRIYLFALETSTLQGVVNAVSPNPVLHSDFMGAFAKETHSLLFRSIPFSRFFFGGFIEDFTISQKVVPQRLIDKGFAFAYTNVREAIADVRHAKD